MPSQTGELSPEQTITSEERLLLEANEIEKHLAVAMGVNEVTIRASINEVRPSGQTALRVDYSYTNGDSGGVGIKWFDERSRHGMPEEQIGILGAIACTRPLITRGI